MGQACRRCRGSCSPILGRGCFGDLPGDRIVASPSPPIVETFFPNSYAGAQAATYSYSEDYAGFGSGSPPSQSALAPPTPHGPSVPSESSSSSFSEQATLAQFTPPGKLKVPSESVVGDVTVPGSYLHSAFIVQSGINEDDVWIADSGASCHMTHDRTRIYNARPPPPGRETITIGDRRRIKVEHIENMDVIFHGKGDQRITLIDVAYVPGLGYNLYSLHSIPRTRLIVSGASGTHIIGRNLTFPGSSSGSYLRATRLPAGTVGARRRQGDMRATYLLRQLRHPIPPPPQDTPPQKHVRDWFAWFKCSGSCCSTGTDPLSPSQFCVGGNSVCRENPSRPECRIGTPLVAAALTPGPQKHDKEVDINHLHVSLAHAHTSILKATAKEHGIRLTGELVSCSACSRAKRVSSTYSISRDEASDAAAGTCPHRHRWALPILLFGVAVCRDVRRQRFACTAAVWRARKERSRHSFCRETLRGRYKGPTRIPH